MLAIAQHLRVVGMPGEEKEMVQVGKESKETEIEEREEGEVEEEESKECNFLFKSEEEEFEEVGVHKNLDRCENNPLSEKIQIPRLSHIPSSVHPLSQMSRRRSRKENGPGPLSAAERQRNWALRMLKDPTTREAFMQRRREYQQRYRDRLSKEGWEEVKKRQREKKKEKYVRKKVQKMLKNQLSNFSLAPDND